METVGQIINRATLAVESNQASLKLQVGQLLSATATAKLSNNLIELLINNQKIQARSEQSIQVGQKLNLRVENVADPILLKVIQPSNQTSNNHLQAIRNDLLKTLLPKAGSFQPLIKTLNSVLNNTQLTNTFSPEFKQNLQTILQSLTQPQQLTNKEGLKQAIKQSGIFLESHIANIARQKGTTQQPNINLLQNDLKVTLLKLASLLNALPDEPLPTNQKTNGQNDRLSLSSNNNVNVKVPEHAANNIQQNKLASQVSNSVNQNKEQVNLQQTVTTQAEPLRLDKNEIGKQIEQALSKIQLQQNNAIILDKQESPVWNISLPVLDKKQIDHLELSIYQDRYKDDVSEQGTWTIELAIEMIELGNIFAKISLHDQQIQTSLWAEKTDTLNLIDQHLDELKNQFAKLGLELGSLQTLHGKPTLLDDLQPKNNLVDLHL